MTSVGKSKYKLVNIYYKLITYSDLTIAALNFELVK